MNVSPKYLSLGKLVKEIIILENINAIGPLRANKSPDCEVLRQAIDKRLELLYSELDKREQRYQN